MTPSQAWETYFAARLATAQAETYAAVALDNRCQEEALVLISLAASGVVSEAEIRAAKARAQDSRSQMLITAAKCAEVEAKRALVLSLPDSQRSFSLGE